MIISFQVSVYLFIYALNTYTKMYLGDDFVKRIVKSAIISIILSGTVAFSVNTYQVDTTAAAKTTKVKGMPKSLRHVWIRGKYKTKITKYHIYWAPSGKKYTSHIVFKYVLKQGSKYTVDSLKDLEQTPYWISGKYMYHGIKGDSTYPLTKWHR